MLVKDSFNTMLLAIRHTLIFLLFLNCMAANATVAVPALSHPVTDLTGTLDSGQITVLENKLTAFEAKKGNPIAVLIVPTTQSKDIAEFGIEVADLWQVDRKNADDGIILIVAKDDGKVYLVVGYALEGIIPVTLTKQIINEDINPYFKRGDYADGIDAGATRLMKLIEGGTLPTSTHTPDGLHNDTVYMLILLGSLLIGFILSILMVRKISGKFRI